MSDSEQPTNLADAFACPRAAFDAPAAAAYLDQAIALEHIAEHKRQGYELLELHAGARLLDVGCGTGDDVRALSGLVAPGGHSVGVDANSELIDEARRRGSGDGVAQFLVADAQRLPFADAEFDAVRTDRVLQHVQDPSGVLLEMARVTKPKGRVMAVEPEWGTLVIDCEERHLTRKIENVWYDLIRNGWIGRHLRALFIDVGLVEVEVRPTTLLMPTLAIADQILGLEANMDRVSRQTGVSSDSLQLWLGALRRSDETGRFFGALTAFAVIGRKP